MYFEAVFQPSSDSEYDASATEFVGKGVIFSEDRGQKTDDR